MTIIHGMKTLPRLVGTALAERLRVMPAVVVTRARQTGKSTLVEHLVQGERSYRSLDDFDVLDAARRDPEALVGRNRAGDARRGAARARTCSSRSGPSIATVDPGASC
jgi:hypothetical protein